MAFAFCYLLGFQLMPRLKGIAAQRLNRPETGAAGDYLKLQPILTRPIDWRPVAREYDEMIKYATALRLGTANPEGPYGTFELDMAKRLPIGTTDAVLDS